MNSNSSKVRRPSEMEEQAYAEIRQRFARQMEESNAVRGSVQRLEQDLTRHTGNAFRQAVSRTSRPENLIETDDGQQWQRSVDLTDDCCPLLPHDRPPRRFCRGGTVFIDWNQ